MPSMLTVPNIYDADLILKATGLIATTTTHTALDLGGKSGVIKAVIDITALEIASDDENYIIVAEGSADNVTFVTLAALQVGAGAAIVATAAGGFSRDVDCVVGREVLYFNNVYRNRAVANSRPVVLRYIRLVTKVAGTIATGINYSAWATFVTHGG